MSESADPIEAAVARLGDGPLEEASLREHVWPLFSRVLERPGIYLANHSLGRPPDRTARDVERALEAWYRDLGNAWEEWLEDRERFRALSAQLVGAKRPDCVVPRSSAGQGLRAVLNALPGRPRVVASDGEFDSLDFILRVYREQGRIELRMSDWRTLSVANAALVVLSSVMFRSGEVVSGLPRLVRAAHAAGAYVLLDVYHHAGVLPLDLDALGVDFAVGGSYKYTRGGPGACWLYVRPGLIETLRTPDTGWFAKQDPFAYTRPEPPQFAVGGDAWLESTPSVFAYVQALAGLEFTLAIGVERLRAYNLRQKQRLAELLEAQGVEPLGAGEEHGAFLCVTHPEADRVAADLGARGVSVDARGDTLRLCPDLLNADEDLERAARVVARALRGGAR